MLILSLIVTKEDYHEKNGLFITALLVIMSGFPQAHAAALLPESGLDERSALIEKACLAFPEFADKICSEPSDRVSTKSNTAGRETVYTETRKISENEYIVYSESSDGVVLLTSASFEYTLIENGSFMSGSNTTMNVTIQATCSEVTGVFTLRNVEYTIIPRGYDQIQKVGSASVSGNCTIHSVDTPVMSETSSSAAYLRYRLTWQFGGNEAVSYASYLTFSVGNDRENVTHVLFV